MQKKNENKSTACRIWERAEGVIREKFLSVQTYLKKQGKPQLTTQQKKEQRKEVNHKNWSRSLKN